MEGDLGAGHQSHGYQSQAMISLLSNLHSISLPCTAAAALNLFCCHARVLTRWACAQAQAQAAPFLWARSLVYSSLSFIYRARPKEPRINNSRISA